MWLLMVSVDGSRCSFFVGEPRRVQGKPGGASDRFGGCRGSPQGRLHGLQHGPHVNDVGDRLVEGHVVLHLNRGAQLAWGTGRTWRVARGTGHRTRGTGHRTYGACGQGMLICSPSASSGVARPSPGCMDSYSGWTWHCVDLFCGGAPHLHGACTSHPAGGLCLCRHSDDHSAGELVPGSATLCPVVAHLEH